MLILDYTYSLNIGQQANTKKTNNTCLTSHSQHPGLNVFKCCMRKLYHVLSHTAGSYLLISWCPLDCVPATSCVCCLCLGNTWKLTLPKLHKKKKNKINKRVTIWQPVISNRSHWSHKSGNLETKRHWNTKAVQPLQCWSSSCGSSHLPAIWWATVIITIFSTDTGVSIIHLHRAWMS